MTRFMLTVFVFGMSACALEPTEVSKQEVQSNDMAGWTIEDPSNTGDATAGEASSVSPENAAVPHVSCSIVQFCNAPGADGTRCLQQGCSLTAALNECSVEAPRVCGTPVCPWIFVALDGRRFINTTGQCR